MGEMCGRTRIFIHSYVLMSNHYHLLLETPEANLVAGMKWFQGTYTQRFNRRHRLSGHLFQGRYKAIPVEAGEAGDYFAAVSEYIHLNPAWAGLLDGRDPDLASYRWSSFPRLVEARTLPAWLRRAEVFGRVQLPDEGGGARRRYRQWMARRTREVLERKGTPEQEEEWRALKRGARDSGTGLWSLRAQSWEGANGVPTTGPDCRRTTRSKPRSYWLPVSMNWD